MRKRFQILLVWLAIMLALLLVFEGILRVLGHEHGRKPYVHDSNLHHLNRKNYQFKKASFENEEEGKHKVIFDKNRRRINENNPRKKGKKEIWFFGDSFTASYELSWENTFVGQVESQTDYSIINYAVESHSPLIYLLQLRQAAASDLENTECIFIQIYNNDVSNDNTYGSRAQFNSNDIPVKSDGGSKFLKDVVSRFAIANTLFIAIKNFKNKSDQQNTDVSITEPAISTYELNPEITDESRLVKSIDQISQLLDSLQLRYYFITIPSKYATVTGDWETKTFTSTMNQYMEKYNIPYVTSLDSVFMNASSSYQLFYTKDTHCTIYGNQLIAEEVLKLIRED